MCPFRTFLAFAIAASAMASPGVPQAAPVSLLVPAYFYPGTGGPGGIGSGWAAMTQAATHGASVVAVLNPNSGPLPGPADPNYSAALTNLEAAGGKAIAYVPTGFGTVPLATVEGQINTYISQYGSRIDGFFLDQMSLLPSTLSYYQALNTYIKGLSSTYLTAGNTGDPSLNGVSPANYLSTADVHNIFEGPNTSPAPGAPGFNNYPYGLNWFLSAPSSDIANIVFDVPDAATMRADVTRAEGLNAGYVYVTDQGLPNPYAQLPSYWNEEVAAITAVPEPGTAALLGVGTALTMALTMALARRRKPIAIRV
jgi:hypothetical protein